VNMSNIGNKYKVGALAVASFAILILGLVALGSLRYFRKTYGFMTVVTSSVQGLEAGAKVKIKGVTIGRVEKLQLGPGMRDTYIFMKFDPEAFARAATPRAELLSLARGDGDLAGFFGRRIHECVAEGLRCQLQYGDITGTLFVDLAYFDPQEHPVPEVTLPPGHPPYVPAVPSATIANIIQDAQKALGNMAQVDVQRMGGDLTELLGKANRLMDEKDMGDLLARINAISANLDHLVVRMNDVLSQERLEQMAEAVQVALDGFNATFASIEKLSEEARVQMLDSRIPETTGQARVLISGSSSALRNIEELMLDLKQSMDELNATLRRAQALIDQLERHPDSLIYGKPGKPVVRPE